MYVIRPIEKKDLDNFLTFALSATQTIPTLPHDPHLLSEKLERAVEAISANPPFKGREQYLFILENLTSHTIEGCCGIHTAEKDNSYGYYYSLKSEPLPSRSLDLMPLKQAILFPQSHLEETSKICTLYLSPEMRHSGLGRLLSLSRFMFIACHLDRFQSAITTELRGVVDENGRSPFWEAIGRHFCDVDCDLIQILYETHKGVASEITSHYPIYCFLLPKDAQEAVGQVHEKTKSAMKMLIDEGFSDFNAIDIFDGGPHLRAETDKIRTIKTIQHSFVQKIVECREPSQHFEPMLISNTKLEDFRAMHQEICIEKEGVILEKQVAQALKVQIGDSVCFNTIK